MTINELHIEIKEKLMQNASEAGLIAFQRFVPGEGQQAYGVRMPVVNAMAKTYKTGGFELVKKLWYSGMHEEKLLSAKILGQICRQDKEKSIGLFEELSASIDNWAQCDALGMVALKPVSLKMENDIFELANRLAKAPDKWQRRIALVMVEAFTRHERLHPPILNLVSKLEADKEYFVKKAVVWVRSSMMKQRAKFNK